MVAVAGKAWFLYVLICSDNTLYTGITNDPDRRLSDHNKSRRGAKYTRSRRPVQMVAKVLVGTRSQALRLEYQFKQLARSQKLQHVKSQLLNFIDASK